MLLFGRLGGFMGWRKQRKNGLWLVKIVDLGGEDEVQNIFYQWEHP